MLDVNMFKNFLHDTLLEQFPDENGNPNKTLVSAVEVAIQEFNALTAMIPNRAIVRFDSDTFQLRVALCYVYEYVLQDHAILHALSLQTMSLSENQVFDNYFRLLQMEKEEIEKMKKQLLDEIKDKEDDNKRYGVLLYHRFPRRN